MINVIVEEASDEQMDPWKMMKNMQKWMCRNRNRDGMTN